MKARDGRGTPPSLLAFRGFAAQRSHARALPLLNLKKKRGCSQSQVAEKESVRKSDLGGVPCILLLSKAIETLRKRAPYVYGTTTMMKRTTTTSKKNWFYKQNNSSARASRFLVHFFDVHCTNTKWNSLMRRFIEHVNIRRQIFLSHFGQG